MPISPEVRRLEAKWRSGAGWPKRLEWIDIGGLRGWTGQRFVLQFPIMAVIGENGVGKSTVLQSVASVYRSEEPQRKKYRYASDFFPETPWDKVKNAVIAYSVREGDTPHTDTVRKPGPRWRGNVERRQRHVEYIDLTRIQPVPARVGYMRLANPGWREVSAEAFEASRLRRLSSIMGRSYDLAKMATTDGDLKRPVPVTSEQGDVYSGFHQGAGETTVAELLQRDLPQYCMVLIDEVESSLHPRAQRRLIRDLAELCRERELQVVLTTHSPYVLDELPEDARAYIMRAPNGQRERKIVYGVSPEFAMTKMDDVPQHECDLYVEDHRAATMLIEILVKASPDLVQRCRTIPYGASSVGRALGEMVAGSRFPRASCVFLDGDQAEAPGCLTLPGDDAPERVVFTGLQAREWHKLADRTGRAYSQVADACNQAMMLPSHHAWIDYAATRLVLGGDTLWQAMCAEWATECLPMEDASAIARAIEGALIGIAPQRPLAPPTPVVAAPVEARQEPTPEPSLPTEPPRLFPQ